MRLVGRRVPSGNTSHPYFTLWLLPHIQHFTVLPMGCCFANSSFPIAIISHPPHKRKTIPDNCILS
jgi:hypothetical protein